MSDSDNEFELDFAAIQKLKLEAQQKQRALANVVDGDVIESSSGGDFDFD